MVWRGFAVIRHGMLHPSCSIACLQATQMQKYHGLPFSLFSHHACRAAALCLGSMWGLGIKSRLTRHMVNILATW